MLPFDWATQHTTQHFLLLVRMTGYQKYITIQRICYNYVCSYFQQHLMYNMAIIFVYKL